MGIAHVQVKFTLFEAIPKVFEPGSVTDPGSLFNEDKLYSEKMRLGLDSQKTFPDRPDAQHF